jgi:hypothetical protein
VGSERIISEPDRQTFEIGTIPWYRRTLRWGQTNIAEIDVVRYDIPWWREHWKRTQVQGVILNAGGIVAYYPTKDPLHYRPSIGGNRDLYGELVKAAREDGLAVIARMDSSKAREPFYRAHPDWFSCDAQGKPFTNGEFYYSCVNSGYYEEYIPSLMREVIERSHPDGIGDNIWCGIGNHTICYCQNCQRRFRDAHGAVLPLRRDWSDPVFRIWIDWNYARRLWLWESNNRVTRQAGGEHCLWLGMNGADITSQCENFRNCKEIFAQAEMVLLDNQSRSAGATFHENTQAGKLIHGLLGWDKVVAESMSMYQHGTPQFRLHGKSAPEARMWMLAGFAGGIQPWWHHVGAYCEDQRIYQTAEPVLRWHKNNERYLINRRPMASVGVVWSQRNTDFYGRDNPRQLVDQPWRGFTQALVKARIPYLPVHIDHIERDAGQISVLILPNVAGMSDSNVSMVRRFVQGGGSLIATGQTSLFDEWGEPRTDFALADLFGLRNEDRRGGNSTPVQRHVPRDPARHTYLRLFPDLRGRGNGPISGEGTPTGLDRHPILAGFDETDLLPFGGMLDGLAVDANAQVLLTYVPEVPISPPESMWMRTPRTDIPGLIVSSSLPGTVVYIPADIDRRYAIDNLPDHGALLGNVVRWLAKESIGLEVKGAGLVDCQLYEQPGRLILHVVNLTSAGTWRPPVDELIAVGPLQIRVRLPEGMRPVRIKRLVANEGRPIPLSTASGWIDFTLESVLDHEVVVIDS